MLAILTRLGKTGKIIINGDNEQKDIKDIESMMKLFENYPDITAILQNLLSGSQRHLQAFQK